MDLTYEKLPKIGSIKDLDNCVVPFIENKNEHINEENARKFNKSVPDDLILSLKQAEQPKEYLGPPSKRNIQSIKPTIPSVLRRPDNAWNHEKQREKYKFLTDQPICSCGAGKDLSFIYDCAMHRPISKAQQPSKFDLSAIRAQEQSGEKVIQIPETLVPDEYKVVKNQGVWPLQYDENSYTTIADDHLNHLTVFPSLKPTSRNEVVQLKHTMDALLKRVGADIIDQKGPTQLHNLLEIIKQEQDIYNIVFHEIIRQVTVECKDRGEILAKLRERYANLLSRVPREIKSLHEEVIAQRALDRRLTEELMQFKATIGYLTEELSKVKEHDEKIGSIASIYQKDLQKALSESQKNASLLSEYHQLYELQRKRLEKTIKMITDERELWIKTAYGIALKVADENKLNSSKRLNIAEKAWSKLALHFSLSLGEKDTKILIELQKLIESWKETLLTVRTDIFAKELQMKNTLDSLRGELTEFKKLIASNLFDENGNFTQSPDSKKIVTIFGFLKRIIELSNKETEYYTGDTVLLAEEMIKQNERTLFNIVKISNKLTGRHPPSTSDEAKRDQYMKYEKLEIDMKHLHEQYRNRSTGDNGLLKCLIGLNNGLDLWHQKLIFHIEGKNGKNKVKITEGEWPLLYGLIDEWIESTNKAKKFVGVPLKEDEIGSDENSTKIIDHDDVVNELHQWISSFNAYIDSQDSYIIEEVGSFHNKMVLWMVEALIYLAPDRADISREARIHLYKSVSSLDEIEKKATDLVESVKRFTESLIE